MNLFDQAFSLHRAGQFAQAEVLYRQFLAQEPTNARAVFLLGMTFIQRNQLAPAMECWQRTIALKPDYLEAHANLGTALAQMKKPAEAMKHLQAALAINPDLPSCHNNLGNVFLEMDRVDEAVEHYRRAIQLKADYFEPVFNLGKTLQRRNQNREAQELLDRALQIRPNDPEAHFLRGLNLLLRGELREGLIEYEWRTRCSDFQVEPRKFSGPIWQGENLAGKTILLHAEQGLGDTIQFIRYAPQLKQMGAKVILECQAALVELMKTMSGIDGIIARDRSLPQYDFHLPVPSLPRMCGTTAENIPNRVPYLSADPKKLNEWQIEKSRPCVGLVWAGNPKHTNDRNRSIAAAELSELTAIDGIEFFNMQVGGPKTSLPLTDFTDRLKDFSDTAAMAMQMDLIVSVDTAVAHLAGALGRPTWVMLPFTPDWRWQLGRADSPWYPTMRLFRQSSPGDWQSVLRQIADNLRDLPQKSPVAE